MCSGTSGFLIGRLLEDIAILDLPAQMLISLKMSYFR